MEREKKFRRGGGHVTHRSGGEADVHPGGFPAGDPGVVEDDVIRLPQRPPRRHARGRGQRGGLGGVSLSGERR